jgi:RecA-family ATPase
VGRPDEGRQDVGGDGSDALDRARREVARRVRQHLGRPGPRARRAARGQPPPHPQATLGALPVAWHDAERRAPAREPEDHARSLLRLPDAADQKRFIAELKAWKPAVVIVDNLTRVLVGDPNSTRDAAAFARAWVEICEETGCALGFLHHTKKPGGGDQKAVDPFNELRGSNDFGACARNIIVTTPIRNETEERLSEVRMRGNLDLRRDGFVMGFERKNMLDRWQARLVDRGDIAEVQEQVAKQQKDNKHEKKKQALVEENQKRKALAMYIAKNEGGVSGTRLAHRARSQEPARHRRRHACGARARRRAPSRSHSRLCARRCPHPK